MHAWEKMLFKYDRVHRVYNFVNFSAHRSKQLSNQGVQHYEKNSYTLISVLDANPLM